MGLWQPFGVDSTASRPKSRGSVFKHEFLGILSTWHGIFCFILLNINYPDRLVGRVRIDSDCIVPYLTLAKSTRLPILLCKYFNVAGAPKRTVG